MELATFDWLLTDAGQAALDRAGELAASAAAALRVGETLRRELSADRAAAVLSQVELRAREPLINGSFRPSRAAGRPDRPQQCR